MNKTRICSLLLALLMLASLFTVVACENGPAAEEGKPNVETQPDENNEETAEPDDAPQTDADPDDAPEEPQVEIRKTMKVLTLGNSFSENAHRYLIDIMKAQGMDDIILGNVVYSACSLQAHYSKAQSGVRDCIYYKFTLKDGEFAEGTNNGKVTTSRYNVNFAFEDEDWDIVILQQVSGQSGIVSSYSPHLDNLVNYIKGKVKADCKLGFHMTWAYQANANHSDFPKYSRNQMTMYNSITNAVQQCVVSRGDFDFIIPAGTAIQNMRTSFVGDTLTKDGYHLGDLGSYVVGYTWYSVLTGDPLNEIKFTPNVNGFNPSAKEIEAVRESVQHAIETPYAVTNSVLTTR